LWGGRVVWVDDNFVPLPDCLSVRTSVCVSVYLYITICFILNRI